MKKKQDSFDEFEERKKIDKLFKRVYKSINKLQLHINNSIDIEIGLDKPSYKRGRINTIFDSIKDYELQEITDISEDILEILYIDKNHNKV